MIIKNGLIFQKSGTFEPGDLYVQNHTIISPLDYCDDGVIVDAGGCYVIPGLIDIHTHGAFGCDFCDASDASLSTIASYERSIGVTTFCPTSMTLPFPQLCDIFATVKNHTDTQDQAHIAGINMEGPFISHKKKGAQKDSCIVSPDIEMFQKLNDISGNNIRITTIAPEEDHAMDFIRTLSHQVCISLGHSDADYETALAAFSAGASHVTHLFNAMPPFHHRDTGIVGAATDSNHVMVEVICDGIHISPSMIRSIFQLFDSSNIIFISDSMRATGMEDGTYELGGQTVYKTGNHALLADGTLAGSVTNLFDCVKSAVSFGIPLETALLCATRNPARSIGIYHQTGSLSIGKKADILLVDRQLNLKKVL